MTSYGKLFLALQENPLQVLQLSRHVIRALPDDDQLVGVNAEAHLANGIIAIQDSIPLHASPTVGAIVGGTGDFARIRGTSRRKIIDDDTVEFTLKFITAP
jgi:hypothetical protein